MRFTVPHTLTCDVIMATSRDTRELAWVDDECYDPSIHEAKWDAATLTDLLFARKSDQVAMGAWCRGTLTGYLTYRVASSHYELTRLAVRPKFRRMGVGSQLVAALNQRVPRHKERIDAVVPETAVGLCYLLASSGWKTLKPLLWNGCFVGGGRLRDAIRFRYRAAWL